MSFPNSLLSVSAVSAVSTVCWFSVYKKCRSKFEWEPEFASRAVAAVHAVIVVFFSFLSIKYGPDPLFNPGEPNTGAQVFTMFVSIGYFIYDFCWCVKHQPEPKIMLYHHLASIVAILYILYHGSSGSEAVGGLGSLEFTNPLLQARWFLRTLGYSDTKIYKLVEVTFFILFLLIRIGYGSWLTLSVIRSDKSPIPVKVCTILLYVISIAFIYSIGKLVARRMVRHSAKPGENVVDEDDDDVKLS